MDGMLFLFSVTERMMQGGGGLPTDTVVSVVGLKWQQKKLIACIQSGLIVENVVPIYILKPWDAERIGTLAVPDELVAPYVDDEIYKLVNEEIVRVIRGEVRKSGIILWGSPGNGKTFFIRHLALRHKLPIYIISFTPKLDNHELIRMFSNIRGPSIVLFEDFDTYFDKRECLMKEASFTFDTLLNVLDGIYSNPSGVLFCMTANDIEKIDAALRFRPSRFRYVLPIENPTYATIQKIFMSDNHEYLEGQSLDEILTLRDREQRMVVGRP